MNIVRSNSLEDKLVQMLTAMRDMASFKFILLQNALWPNGQIMHNLH